MKARTAVFAFSLCSVALLMAEHSRADPVHWAGNGNWYEVVTVDPLILWNDADIDASASVFMGMSGHLATITSGDENLFVSGLSPDLAGYHLGGLLIPGAGWQWVTAEPFGYTNWNVSEPNGGGSEDRLQLIAASNADGLTWNDFSAMIPAAGYIVEYEALAAIPEPQTYALLLAGLGLLGFAARRRK